MSDLSATQFDCPESRSKCCNWIWILLIAMVICNCCGDRRGGFCICDLLKGDCCEMMIIIILLVTCCCKPMR